MSIPVLKIYDENHNPIPVPAIRGEKGEKGDRGERGPKGEPGGLTVKGYYSTLSALEQAVPSPVTGEVYGVGASAPYNIYIWDGNNNRWVDNGTIQGAKGDKGDKGDTGDTGPQGVQGPKGEPGGKGDKGDKGDTGDAGPQGAPGTNGSDGQDGHTPVKGTDYWTSADKAAIIEDVLEEIYQGADLGLQIVTQLNSPANPSDNMIWVETETDMPVGKYIVSSQQPTSGLVNGFLWLREMYLPLAEITLPGSHVSLSIAQVWQYENNTWVWKQGHIYKSSDAEWKDTGVYWFKEGTGFNSAVFGAVYNSNPSYIVIDQNKSCLQFSTYTSGYTSYVNTQTGIQAGRFHYLVVDAEILSSSLSFLRVGIGDPGTPGVSRISQELYDRSRGLTVIDISAITTAFVPMCQRSSDTAAKIYNLWLV